MATLNATRSASVSPPPPAGAVFTPSSLTDAELAQALSASKALPTWFRAEPDINEDSVAGTTDRHVYIEQVSGPALGAFSVSRSGDFIEVDHLPIIDGHMTGNIAVVGLYATVERAFEGIATWVRAAICPEFLAV